MIGLLSLHIDCLIASVLFLHKEVHESANLSFCPMLQKWHLLEKLDLLLDIFGLYFFKNAGVVFTADRDKGTLCQSFDGRLSGFVVDEG